MQQSSHAPQPGVHPGTGVLQTEVWSRPARRPLTSPPVPKTRWSRYERLSFTVLGYTWGILVLAVSGLHIGNYHLETRTSSTSGTHSDFYETGLAVKPAPGPASDDPTGVQP